LPTLHSIIVGDAVLGAPRKRSATNPQLLNWRQRDAVSQILPDLVLLYGPIEVRQYLWPVLQMLLADKVNAVRDDVEFCIPTVLRSYAPENVAAADRSVNAKAFSREACDEVVTYLKESLLENGGIASRTNGSYARRQMYCRTCAALAIALRLGKSDDADRIKTSPTDEVVSEVRSRHPYESYTPSEYRHMHSLLEDVFLPDALNMREDRVSNVRLTLVDALKVMPEDILEKENVNTILTTLEDEARTWDVGFGAEEYGNEENVPTATRGRSATTKRSGRTKAEDRKNTTPNRRSKFDKQAAAQDDAKNDKEIMKDGAVKKDNIDDEDDSNSLSSI
jgi:serine/threonine-protein phosphatase 4 regulatory subunit 1